MKVVHAYLQFTKIYYNILKNTAVQSSRRMTKKGRERREKNPRGRERGKAFLLYFDLCIFHPSLFIHSFCFTESP
jgi:hypothetical protein